MHRREEPPKRGLAAFLEAAGTLLNNSPYFLSYALAPAGSPSMQNKFDITMPLRDYANVRKYYFWSHKHADRARELQTKILRANTFQDIIVLISDEISLYPGHRVQTAEPLSDMDKNFMNKTNSYKENELSGYYNALHNTLNNVMAFNNPHELKLEASYKG